MDTLSADIPQQTDPEVRRCRALWRAVIAQELRDLAIYGTDLSKDRLQHKTEAGLWFGIRDGVPRGTPDFREVAGFANLSHEALIKRLAEIMAMNLSDAARSFVLNDLAMQINRGPLDERFKPGGSQE